MAERMKVQQRQKKDEVRSLTVCNSSCHSVDTHPGLLEHIPSGRLLESIEELSVAVGFLCVLILGFH